MSLVRMVAPVGLSGISVRGMAITAVDGIVEVEPSVAEELVSHGFGYEQSRPLETQKAVLLNAILRSFRTTLECLSDSEISEFSGLSDDERSAFYSDLSTAMKKWPAVTTARRKKESTKLPEQSESK